MTTKSERLVIVCSAMLLAAIAMTTGSQRLVERIRSDGSVNPFRERVAAYSRLRQEIAGELLEHGIDPNAEDGREFRRRLGLAIRKVRRHARAGEIFDAQVANRMRHLARKALQGADDILSEVPDVANVRVNDRYPEGEPLATVPPSLIRQFEPLPPELQYRFLGTALILLDIDTALIVDVIPDAFQRGA
jgi:hypothetical protein